MDDAASVRQAIAAALELVLPGRVYTHPPTSKRYVTPSIWIEDPDITEQAEGIVATFPVWIVVDGAIQSQVAAMDAIRWNAWLALSPIAAALQSLPAQLVGYRAAVLNVSVIVTVETLCGLPAAQTVRIPVPAA